MKPHFRVKIRRRIRNLYFFDLFTVNRVKIILDPRRVGSDNPLRIPLRVSPLEPENLIFRDFHCLTIKFLHIMHGFFQIRIWIFMIVPIID